MAPAQGPPPVPAPRSPSVQPGVHEDDARAYQLRARLNQVLKRIVAEIRFHPGTGGKDGKSGRKVKVQLRGTVTVMDNETGETEENDGYILEMM